MSAKKIGSLIIVSAASGTGKTTLINLLRKEIPSLGFSISATTRPPREGETDGAQYHFLSDKLFSYMVSIGNFLEWAKVHNRRYGTLLKETEKRLAQGENIILDIDVQGAQKVLAVNLWTIPRPQIISIFVEPPDMEALENRLRTREGQTENMALRLENARGEIEIGRQHYDHVVVNPDGEAGKASALCAIKEILKGYGIP
jgi:guanylate kinase